MLTEREVLDQSKNAMKQWESTWDKHAVKNGELLKKIGKSHKELLYNGVGRTLICCATGPSLEKNIELLKNLPDHIDIITVDKGLGMLLDNGIKPKYVVLADAGISYKRWCEPYIDKIKDIHLIANVCGNPDWTYSWHEAGSPVWFFVNKDNIQSEERYAPMSGCREAIPASSNVGNAVVVFSAQVLGYDKYLLLGYDYGWSDDDNYYAFNDEDKRFWMKHLQMIDFNGNIFNTSQNLLFSARWMSEFYKNNISLMGVRVYNCSGQGILEMPRLDLARQIKSSKQRILTDKEKLNIMKVVRESKIVTTTDIMADSLALQKVIQENNVSDVVVNYIPKWAMKFFDEAVAV